MVLRLDAVKDLRTPETSQKFFVGSISVMVEKRGKGVLSMARKWMNPSRRNRLVKNVSRSVVVCELFDAVSNSPQRVFQLIPMQRQPGKSQVIAVTKHRGG